MTDRINLNQLRAQASLEPADHLNINIYVPTLRALIDAVQAAHELVEADEGDNLTAIIRAAKRLRDALDRFDHT